MAKKTQYWTVNEANEMMTEITRNIHSTAKMVNTELDVKKLAEGRIHKGKETTSIPRTQYNEGIAQAFRNAVEAGPKSCKQLPTKASVAGLKSGIKVMHTVGGNGELAGQQFPAFIWGLKSYEFLAGRRAGASRGANYYARIEEAVANGTAYYAQIVGPEGTIITVSDENGNPRPAADMKGAMSIGARAVHAQENNLTFAEAKNWYKDDVNGSGHKDYLKSCVVGCTQNTAQPADLPQIANMKSQEIIKLAKENGAPVEVTRSGMTSAVWLTRKNLAV